MATDDVSENNNLSELYENLIVIGSISIVSLSGNSFSHLSSPVSIFTDCGANLTNKKFFRDLDLVLKRSKDAGKEKFSFWARFIYTTTLLSLFVRNKYTK